MKRLLISFFIALSVSVSFAMAHHTDEHGAENDNAVAIGPVVGSQAPTLSVKLSDGSPATLDDLEGEKGTIIAFVRSADWCPYCQRQLVDLQSIESELLASGWQIAGLSYDTPEKLAAFAAKSDVSFPLLSDPGSETIKAFGLLNEEVSPTSRSFGIPHPALVFINSDGTIAAVIREEGYRTRPSLDAIRTQIESLG